MDNHFSLFCETAGFSPPISGEELCYSVRKVSTHIEAIMPKGCDIWELVFKSEEVVTGVEVSGIALCGRNIELSTRFPGGTWVRVRGLPLDTTDTKVSLIFEHFGRVVSGPHHVTWRGTTIKTGDRTLKIKLERNIPQSFMTLEGKTKITTRYRDQPKTCFECGSLDHKRKDCPVNERGTYAQAVADAQKPTGSEEMFNIDVVLPEVTPDVTQTSSESDV